MLTAEQCQAFAREFKRMSQATNISMERAFILKNISRSLAGLAGQLDRLAAKIREEKG